jgi:hypothetical protein
MRFAIPIHPSGCAKRPRSAVGYPGELRAVEGDTSQTGGGRQDHKEARRGLEMSVLAVFSAALRLRAPPALGR